VSGACWMRTTSAVESSWNVMAHSDAREGKWRGNWRMQWVASTLHTTSEHGESSITNADAHTSAASSRLNWRPHRFKWTRPFRRKTKSGFCACGITFQLASTTVVQDNDQERKCQHLNKQFRGRTPIILSYLLQSYNVSSVNTTTIDVIFIATCFNPGESSSGWLFMNR
jgi:hypothetical protein